MGSEDFTKAKIEFPEDAANRRKFWVFVGVLWAVVIGVIVVGLARGGGP